MAVVGPSGCGKTTLLKILAGLMPASRGDARLRGTSITTAQELVTNELIDEINRFDPDTIAAEARAFRAGG
ncbi:MAG TPA: ATP-binding cassette domain-containing protein [Methylomirabilota bacterium]